MRGVKRPLTKHVIHVSNLHRCGYKGYDREQLFSATPSGPPSPNPHFTLHGCCLPTPAPAARLPSARAPED